MDPSFVYPGPKVWMIFYEFLIKNVEMKRIDFLTENDSKYLSTYNQLDFVSSKLKRKLIICLRNQKFKNE